MTTQPVSVLLENPEFLMAVGWKGLGIDMGPRNPFAKWESWGTLLNRDVIEARRSDIGGIGGRGLFAGRTGEGFKLGQVITLYGGRLLTRKQMDETPDHSYMMRVSGSGQGEASQTVVFVDGKQFAEGITHEEGDVYLPFPGDRRAFQGAGSLANDSRGPAGANAKLEFRHSSTVRPVRARLLGFAQCGSKIDIEVCIFAKYSSTTYYRHLDKQKVLPKIPMLVAKRHIAPGDEILFYYGTDKPHVEEGPQAKRQRVASDEASAAPSEALVPPQAGAGHTQVGDVEKYSPAFRSVSGGGSAAGGSADVEENAPVFTSCSAGEPEHRSLAAEGDEADAPSRLEDEELLAKLAELGW